MKIAVDAMGGDFSPIEIVHGACDFAKENPSIEIVLIGSQDGIDNTVAERPDGKPGNIEYIYTNSVVTMEDDPMIVMKEKNDSSMAVGLKLLKEGGADAFVSAGSTGALHVASSLIVRKIRGIRRSAIATVIPFKNPILMLDSGANPDVTPDILNSWAVVGSAYYSNMFNQKSPRVGLLNNGTEEHKGTDTVKAAYQLLKNNDKINFVGNIESKDLPLCPCDILITDGFTGNVTLKLIEGMGKFMFTSLKEIFMTSFKTKMAYLLTKKQLKSFKKSFDSSEYGGAPLLGLCKPVIKAHGSSKRKEIKSAMRQAVQYYESKIIEKVDNSLNS